MTTVTSRAAAMAKLVSEMTPTPPASERAEMPRVEHGHLDPEADPSYESNVTIHGHAGGGTRHQHPDAPSWGAIGTEYVWPERAKAILANTVVDEGDEETW